MIRVYMNCYQMWWCPTSFAMHTRVQFDESTEVFFCAVGVVETQRPCQLSLVNHVFMGTATQAEVAAARDNVDVRFTQYHVLTHNCNIYAFCLCSALFHEEVLLNRFPRQCNRVVEAATGWDFGTVNARAGCHHSLVNSVDMHRALRHCVADGHGVTRVLACTVDDAVRRDVAIRGVIRRHDAVAACSFLWRSLVVTVVRDARLRVLVEYAVPTLP